MKKWFVLFVFAVVNAITGLAQNYESVWNYDISHGLPTNSIYHLLIDRKGKVWFGSDLGVTSYDGQIFTTYTTEDGLTDNTVLRCFEDKSGRIWFHHNNKLPSYYENGKITPIKVPDRRFSITSNSNFVQTENGTIYLGGTGGFLQIDKNLKASIKSGNNNYATIGLHEKKLVFMSLKKERISQFIYFSNYDHYQDGEYLPIEVLMRSGDFLIEKIIANNWISERHADYIDPKLGYAYFIKENKGKIYLSTANGIYIFAKDEKKWKLKSHLLVGKKIVSLDFDRFQNLWASSLGEGLFFFPASQIKKNPSLKKNDIFSQSRYKNHLYLTRGVDELWSYDGETMLEKKSNINEQIFHFNYFADGSVFFNTPNKYTYIQKNITRTIQDESKTFCTKKHSESNSIYLGLPSGFSVWKEDGTIDKTYATSLGRTKEIVEYKKEIYLANQIGLYRLKNDIPYRYLSQSIGKSRVNDLEVFNNQLIIATGNVGLLIYNGKDVERITINEGLIDNQVTLIHKTSRGTLWISTKTGLQEFKIQKGKCIEIRRVDTKTKIKIPNVNEIEDLGRYLILSTDDGIYSVDLSFKRTRVPISIGIESILLNETLQKSTLKRIEYGDNIKIIADATNYSKHPTEYFYRINNGQWVKNRSETFLFPLLSAGKYEIDFRAKTPFYLESKVLRLKLEVHQKWYQNSFLIVNAITIALLLIIVLLRRRALKNSERKRNELKTELLSLQSQMNPHFTFNSLNSIQSYLATNDKRSAQIYLADFSTLMRKILDQARLSLIPLEEEIDFLKNYLELEKRRLEGQFEYEITVDPNINKMNTGIPTLMIQPFVENAIWHGVAKKDSPGKITLEFKLLKNEVICTLNDDGPGLNATEEEKKVVSIHKSTGIANCRERMRIFKEIYQHSIDLDVANRESGGTTVTIKFPNIGLHEKRI